MVVLFWQSWMALQRAVWLQRVLEMTKKVLKHLPFVCAVDKYICSLI